MTHNSGPNRHTNRLISEKSPYLLQHAHNPVDWHPWGEEAFAKAASEDKPVFLSIGYSTCHWCHVMEKESFEDEEVAAVINKHFIPVKVDREERPDIDNTYMNVCQMLTGGGGWPLSIFLTPEKKPIYTATYIPKAKRHESPGIIVLLEKISQVWKENRGQIEESGDNLIDTLQRIESTPREKMPINDEPLRTALHYFKESYDAGPGGFGQAPKFPMAHNFLLLFRLWDRFGDEQAKEMTLETLRAIRKGGIYDQLGGGVHRYSVDREWLVPHFEKMLYDQALLALAAVEAFQVSHDLFFSEMAGDILYYVVKNLTHPEGGFFCGEDADSEGREGTYYIWDKKEILQILGDNLGEFFCKFHGVTEGGNFEGQNILHKPVNAQNIEGISTKEPTICLYDARHNLLKVRDKREHPFLDDKVLSGWNGLVIAALCRAGSTLEDQTMVQAARRSADFILSKLYDKKKNRLLRRWRNGEAAIPAFLEDYSFFCWGLIELYMHSFDSHYLRMALQLTAEMEELFSDGNNGFYDTGSDSEFILTRGKNIQDTALPSGSSVAVLNLVRLGRLTGDLDMAGRGENHLAALYSEYFHHPVAYTFLLTALDSVLGPSHELVIAVSKEGPAAENLHNGFFKGFFPRTVLHSYTPDNQDLVDIVPVVHGKTAVNGLPTAYVCSDKGCQPPTTELKEMLRLLKHS